MPMPLAFSRSAGLRDHECLLDRGPRSDPGRQGGPTHGAGRGDGSLGPTPSVTGLVRASGRVVRHMRALPQSRRGGGVVVGVPLSPLRAQRPFPRDSGTVRGIYGPCDRLRATIAGPRGVRVGRNPTARQERRGEVLAVLEAGDQEAEGLVCDSPVDAVRALPREAVSAAPPRAGFRLLRSVSQHTHGITAGWRGGAAAPLRSPRKTSAPAAFAVGESARPTIPSGRGRRFAGESAA